jgi:hypothetical protein
VDKERQARRHAPDRKTNWGDIGKAALEGCVTGALGGPLLKALAKLWWADVLSCAGARWWIVETVTVPSRLRHPSRCRPEGRIQGRLLQALLGRFA